MAETVKTNEFAGGSGLDQGKLARVIRGLIDDRDSLQATTIASGDATFTEITSPDASDLGSAQTLVNEIKAAYNADVTLLADLANEIKTALNALAAVSSTVTKA